MTHPPAKSIPRTVFGYWNEGRSALAALPTWTKAALWLQALVTLLSLIVFIKVLALSNIRTAAFVKAVLAGSFPEKAEAVRIMGDTMEKTGGASSVALACLLFASLFLAGVLMPMWRHKTHPA